MKRTLGLFLSIALLTGSFPHPGVSKTAPKKTHRVARGESLWEIAKKYGISVADLQEKNPGVRAMKLKVGARLVIPKPDDEAKSDKTSKTKTTEAKSSAKQATIAEKPSAPESESSATSTESPAKPAVTTKERPDRRGKVSAPAKSDEEEPSTLELMPETVTPKTTVAKISFIYPLKKAYRISSDFGHREDPFHGKGRFHAGVDIAAPAKTPIYAMQAGKVLVSLPFGGYGYLVVLEHEGGWLSLYGHLSRVTFLPGERVKQGDFIGEVGSTGRATGSHLHLEVRRNGAPVDPMDFVPFPKRK